MTQVKFHGKIGTQVLDYVTQSLDPLRGLLQRLGSLIGMLLLYSVCIAASAQSSYLGSYGQVAWSTPSPVEYGYVEQANGHLHLEIPLNGAIPQRGSTPVGPYTLAYDSNIWLPSLNFIGKPQWGSLSGNTSNVGWNLLPDWNDVVYGCGIVGNTCVDDYYIDLNRTTHYFPSVNDAATGPNNSYATDSSGLYDAYNVDPAVDEAGGSIYAPDGSLLPSSLGYTNQAKTKEYVIDANGNYFGASNNAEAATPFCGAYALCDTVGRQVNFLDNEGISPTTGIGTSTFSFINSQGTTSSYRMITSTIQATTNFNWTDEGTYIPECNKCSAMVVSEIDLPDGSKFTFKYDCDETVATQAAACDSPSGQAAYYAELTSMTTPAGGTIQYTYQKFYDAYGVPSMWIASRTTPDGLWTYVPQVVFPCPNYTSVGCQQSLTVHAPNKSKTFTVSTLNAGESSWPTQILTYDESGNLYSTTNVTWDFSQPCGFSGCVGNGYIRKLAEATTIPTMSGSMQTRQTTYSYDSIVHGNVSAVKEWGYYPGASPQFPSIPDRATYTTYYSPINSPVAQYGVGGTNIINKPSSVTICNNAGTDSACPGGGSKVAQTLTTYDVYGSTGPASVTGIVNHDDSNYGASLMVRGNPTSISKWISSSTYAKTQMTYDTTGQVTSSTDPKGNITTYNFADNMYLDSGASPSSAYSPSVSTNAYVTKVTLPAASGMTFTKRYGYYYGSGKLALSTDENNNSTYFHYLDPLDRPTSTIYPLGWALTAYTSPTQTDSYRPIGSATPSTTCTSCMRSTVSYDGLGRVKQTQDAANALVTTAYNSMGWVASVSNPYLSNTDATYGVTYYGYDFLGRTSLITHPDSTFLQILYNGNTATSIDENKNDWLRKYDGFGRLTSVVEPNGSSSSPAMETDYIYDALNNLISVTQWGGASGSSGAIQRTFTYDGLSRLLTSANPETGTLCYGIWSGTNCVNGYDLNGNLSARTDARGITTSYSYDALNRLLSKTYPSGSGTPSSCFQYDTSSLVTAGGNLSGRLTNSWTQTGTCPASSSPPSFSSNSNILSRHSILAYDVMGRVSNEQQCTRTNCSSGAPYSPAYTYDLAGHVVNHSNGVPQNSMTFTNGYDGAGHLNSIVNGSNALFTAPALSSPSSNCNTSGAPGYSPAGELMSATLGNSLSVTRSYDNRLRVNCEIDTGTVVRTQ